MTGEAIVGNGDVRAQIVELRAEVQGLRGVLTERQSAALALEAEREKRFTAINELNAKAVAAAFASSELATKTAFEGAEKASAAAFASAERAAAEFKEALGEYKRGANEWRDTVKDLIGNLRESRSESIGTKTEHTDNRGVTIALFGMGLTVVGLMVTVIVLIARLPR